jgi:hypothetical protein
MLLEEFSKQRDKSQEGRIIVPIGDFIAVVSEKTKWTPDELKTKDIGEIEEKLNIQAKKPNNLWSIKRGKSRSSLYRFVGQEKKKKAKDLVTNILSE